MKTISKYFSYFGLALALCVMIFSGCSCSAPKPQPDPLAGFHAASGKLDPSIVSDYQNYIENLSPEEKEHAIPVVQYFEDGAGQHAVEIMITLDDHANWRHILIYDKDNKRIKTIKYISGHSMS